MESGRRKRRKYKSKGKEQTGEAQLSNLFADLPKFCLKCLPCFRIKEKMLLSRNPILFLEVEPEFAEIHFELSINLRHT